MGPSGITSAPDPILDGTSDEPMQQEVTAAIANSQNDGQAQQDCSLEQEQLRDPVSELLAQIRRLKHERTLLNEPLSPPKGQVHELRREQNSPMQPLENEKARTAAFCIERFKDSNEDFAAYTGLPDYEHFLALKAFLDPGENGCNMRRSGCASSSSSSLGRKRKL